MGVGLFFEMSEDTGEVFGTGFNVFYVQGRLERSVALAAGPSIGKSQSAPYFSAVPSPTILKTILEDTDEVFGLGST